MKSKATIYCYKILDCDIYWANKSNNKKSDMDIYEFQKGKMPNGYWPILKLVGHEYYYPKSKSEAKSMIEEYLDSCM